MKRPKGEEVEGKEKLKSKWAALEALVGTERRIDLIAKDLVEHFERRREAMEGKGMVVCMSRRICVELYDAIVALRPGWHSEDDEAGQVKVVMTGSASDPLEWQQHIRNKARRDVLAKRFKDPADPFKLVIVRDMWLTGFDAPALHTMYVDKPMRGHGLMQAIARVNRVFKDKPGGLVVDYLGLADQLRGALATYTQSGGTGSTAIDQAEAVTAMKTKYEVGCALFHGFDWALWHDRNTHRTPVAATRRAGTHPRSGGRKSETPVGGHRPLAGVCAGRPHADALAIRDDVAFFQAVRTALAKSSKNPQRDEDLDHAIRQIVSKAVSPGEVVDIFAMAGLNRPDISILSDEFLTEIRHLPHRNLAVEVFRKLLTDEIGCEGARTSFRRGRSRSCWNERWSLPKSSDRNCQGHRGADCARQRYARGGTTRGTTWA